MGLYEMIITLGVETDSSGTKQYFIGNCCSKDPEKWFFRQSSLFEDRVKVYVTQEVVERNMFAAGMDFILNRNAWVSEGDLVVSIQSEQKYGENLRNRVSHMEIKQRCTDGFECCFVVIRREQPSRDGAAVILTYQFVDHNLRDSCRDKVCCDCASDLHNFPKPSFVGSRDFGQCQM